MEVELVSKTEPQNGTHLNLSNVVADVRSCGYVAARTEI